jgi:hypothetical protein
MQVILFESKCSCLTQILFNQGKIGLCLQTADHMPAKENLATLDTHFRNSRP